MDSSALIHCCNEIDLLAHILKIDESQTPIEVAPSVYMAQVKISAEERLEKIKQCIRNPKPSSNSISSVFDVFPNVVIFQNYARNCSYIASLMIRNKKCVMKPLRGIFEPSPNFSVTYASKGSCTDIAPGISIYLNIRFCAEELKDYKYSLKFSTEGEEFVVPVIAVGPRPILDLPDVITVPSVPVKMESTSTILVRNLGMGKAVFAMNISPPFFVNVTKGILNPNQDMQLIITFKPEKLSKYKRHLLVSFETEEKLIVEVKSSAFESTNIYLEKGSIKFNKTYMGLTRKREIGLINNSKNTVKFEWKMYASSDIDQRKIEIIEKGYKNVKKLETIKCNRLETYGIISEDDHSIVYERILQDEVKELVSQCHFPYKHECFQIIPMNGEIMPNSTFNITIIFSPKLVKTYSSSAYLDVAGREKRLRLIMNGECIGANIILNLTHLDAHYIYMCSIHQYEVVAMNKGSIPGEISFIPTKTEFGSIISCDPLSLQLNPNECGAFTLEFTSRQKGKFYEDVQFEIKHSKEIVRFALVGEIVCPLLIVDVMEIDYGVVPVGYPTKQTLILHNRSLVPIEFFLCVKFDGSIPATKCEELALKLKDFQSCNDPKEFSFNPLCGFVDQNSSLDVEIILTANIVRRSVSILTIKMWNSDDHILELPIRFNARVPDISCIPPQINIRFCFVNYPYKRTITLRNTTALSGFFQIITDSPSREEGIICTSSITEGSIKPLGEVDVELTIETRIMGEDKMPLLIRFFGDQPILFCFVTCKGQGPVVTIQPEEINFDKVKLLETVHRTLKISNESPISAFVTTKMSSRSLINVKPRTLQLSPESSADLNVSLYLINPVKIHEKLLISVEDGVDTACLIKAKGYGSSILTEPPLEPFLNIGKYLTYTQVKFWIKVINMGKQHHKLRWLRHIHVKQGKSSDNKETIPSIFQIVPATFELDYKDSIQICIEGYSEAVDYVKEDFHCQALIEKKSGIKTIIKFGVVASFVDPILIISKDVMRFRKEVAEPESSYEFLEDTVSITNHSYVPIEIDLYLQIPFVMKVNSHKQYTLTSTRIQLEHLETYNVVVKFQPPSDDKRCYTVEKTLVLDIVSHPKTETIQLIGVVNYPNVLLSTEVLSFPCLSTKASDVQQVMVKNVSPFTVTFNFAWQEERFAMEKISSPDISITRTNLETELSRASSASLTFLEDLEKKKLKALSNQVFLERLENKNKNKNKKGKISKQKNKEKKKKNYSQSLKSLKGDTSGVIKSETRICASDTDYELFKNHEPLRKEFIYQRKIVEKRASYHFFQIQEILYPPKDIKDAIFFPKKNLEYLFSMRNLLHDITESFDERVANLKILTSLPEKQATCAFLKSVLDVLPSHGVLMPYECQIVEVGFNPVPKTCVKAQLQCHVLGGAFERLNILGFSSEISYSISDTFIEFSRQVFCISSEKTIILSNTGNAKFEFLTSNKLFYESAEAKSVLKAGCIRVIPKEGVLNPGESVPLQVGYLPGISGEFNEEFFLEVGYLPPLAITVHGYGVFPQVYLYLPRPKFETISCCLTYFAIASFTPDYLLSLNSLSNAMHYINKVDCYEEDISTAARHNLQKEGWIIVSYNDIYPSIMDIDLAIERTILYQHISNNPWTLRKHIKNHKAIGVPAFSIPPYLVDFGYVTCDSTVNYTILIFNYGPINAIIRMTPWKDKQKSPESVGFVLKFPKTIIKVGDIKELFVTFHPTLAIYPQPDTQITFTFCLEVAHGPKIPIDVIAIVTVPKIETNVKYLNFGSVRCGNCRKKSLFLFNNGCITSEYQIKLASSSNDNKSRNKEDIFHVTNPRGVLEKDTNCMIDVYFEPKFEGNAKWLLNIIIDKNPNSVVVILQGNGLMPTLKIQSSIQFEPVLPYTQNCEKIIEIKNVSKFPVEVILSDFDKEINEDEKVINTVAQYYNVSNFLIPIRIPGEKLPQPLVDFYLTFLEYFRNQLIQTKQEQLQQNFDSSVSLTDNRKEIRRSRTRRKSSSKNDISRSTVSIVQKSVEAIVSSMFKTPEEIEELIKENMEGFIQELNNSHRPIQEIDPVRKVLMDSRKFSQKVNKPDLRNQVYIIFHGAPFTNVAQTSNRVGLDIELPVYSVDALFFESIISCSNSASSKLSEMVNAEFVKIATEDDLIAPQWSDEYDYLEQKIDLLCSNRVAKPKSKKGNRTNKKGKKISQLASSKGSKGSKQKGKKVLETPTLRGLPQDLLCEVLQKKLATLSTGVVIESLYSKFMKQPLMVLENLLKAIGNARHIQFVVLSFTFQDYIQYKEDEKKIDMIKENQYVEETLHKLSSMSTDEIENLAQRELQIYREFVLAKRKEKSLEMHEAIQKRLGQKLMGKNKEIQNFQNKKKTLKTPSHREKSAHTHSSTTKGLSSKMSKSSVIKKTALKDKHDKDLKCPEKKMLVNFESEMRCILNLLEHWDRKLAVCTKPYQQEIKSRKEKMKKLTKSSKSSKSSKTKSSKSSKTSKENKSSKEKKSLKKNITPESLKPREPLYAQVVDFSNLTEEEDLHCLETGVPVWIILNAHNKKPVDTLVSYYLQNAPELTKNRLLQEESLEVNLKEEIEDYTILNRRSEKRTKNLSNIFQMSDFVAQFESKSLSDLSKSISSLADKQLSSKISLLGRSKNSKRRTRSSSSNKIASKIMLNELLNSANKLTTRTVLNPGEIFRYKVLFLPEKSGTYNHTFTVELTGWPSKYCVTCSGVCDIPQIDINPEIMFNNVVNLRTKKDLYKNNIFLIESGVFEFGPVLICNGYKDSDLLAIKSDFALKNISAVPCETSFSFLRDNTCFIFYPALKMVMPNLEESLTVRAISTETELTANKLIISIKNNPKIETINLTCTQTHLKLNVFPKKLSFERVLVNQLEIQYVTIVNNSEVSINFEILKAAKLPKAFKIFPFEGHIGPVSNKKIKFKFYSEVVVDIPKLKLEFNFFFGDCKCITPLRTETVEITAEVVEVKIDCDEEIDLGEIKAQFEFMKIYELLNKGKYPVMLQLTELLPEQDPSFINNEALRNYFTFIPSSGTLESKKTFKIKIKFFGEKSLKFKKVPVINFNFHDSTIGSFIRRFPLRVTGKTCFSSYNICPTEQLNFGYLTVGSGKVLEISVANTGKFDFKYSVISESVVKMRAAKKSKKQRTSRLSILSKRSKSSTGSKGSKSSKVSKGSKRSKVSTRSFVSKRSVVSKRSKMSKMSKFSKASKFSRASRKDKSGKSNKKDKHKKSTFLAIPKKTTLVAGNFSITSSTGITKPGETTTIEVTCRPIYAGSISEKIFLVISESSPKYRDGHPIMLKVICALPTVDFENYDLMFREQYRVSTMAEFQAPKEAGPHCIFIKEERRLHFSHVMINTEAKTRIRLQNNGPVPADILVKVISADGIFQAKPNKLFIESYVTSYVTVSFTPNEIITYSSQLQIHYENGGLYKFEIALSGDGVVPEIVLEEPLFDLSDSCKTIVFQPVLVGKKLNRVIAFKNVGIIPCQVIVEIFNSTSNSFSLIPLDDTKSLVKVSENVAEATAHTNIVNLKVDESATLKVEFKPTEVGICNCSVKLQVVNNPFETMLIFVTAESYINEVIIEGLETYVIMPSELETNFRYTSPGYKLNFGYVFVNYLQKICFTISNTSKENIYKFEFVHRQEVTFIPAVGHLKPGASKDVVATLLCIEPIEILKDILECSIYKIVYIKPELELLSWDERQNVIIWEPIINMIERRSDSPLESEYHLEEEGIKTSQLLSEINPDWTPSEAMIKTLKAKREPEIEVIPDTVMNYQIALSAICNYSSYECSDTCVTLSDTPLFEKNSYTFYVTNTSNVCLDLTWKISRSDIPRIARSNTAPLEKLAVRDCKREFLHIRRLINSARQVSSKNNIVNICNKPIELQGSEQFMFNKLILQEDRDSLFSSESRTIQDESSQTILLENHLPFTINPGASTIEPNKTKNFEITFMPRIVFDYFISIQSRIANLHPSCKQIYITVAAKSLLPLCYFDLSSSDYLQDTRKGKRMCGDHADENTKVIHFDAVGLGVPSIRTFKIINPNKKCIFYKWIPLEMRNEDISLFHCHKPEGYIKNISTTEATFSFFPREIGVYETFYEFYIEKQRFSKTFLLVGNAREANVNFNISHLLFKPTVLGIDVAENLTLKNYDNLDIDFRFKQCSLYSEAKYQALVVEPMRGTLKAYDEQQIRVKYHPTKKGESNFTLKCKIDKNKKALLLPVTTNCYDISPSVCYECNEGEKIKLSSEQNNIVEVKSMIPHTKQSIRFTIKNLGITGFYYSWSVKEDTASERFRITFVDKKGYVKSDSNVASVMNITPLTQVVVTNLIIKLEIRYGPTYTLQIKGKVANIPFTFSFHQFDFGPCLIQKGQTTYYKKVLDFKNNDNVPVILESKLPEQDFLSISLKSQQVEAKTSEPITIWFHPQNIKKYQMAIQFYVNSKARAIKVFGEGVPRCIFLSDPCDKFIDMGSILIGQTTSKIVKVINDGLTPVEIIFNFQDRLPLFSSPKKILPPDFERVHNPPIIAKVTTNENENKIITKKKGKKRKKKGKEKGFHQDKHSNKEKDSKSTKSSQSEKSKKSKSIKNNKDNLSVSKKSKKSKKTKMDKLSESNKSTSGESKKSKKSKLIKSKKGKYAKRGSVPMLKAEDSDSSKTEEGEEYMLKHTKSIRNSFNFVPTKFVRVPSHQSTEFVITFSPTERMKTFSETVYYQVQDSIQSLCTVRVSSLASKYELDKDFVTFGSSVLGYYSTKKVKVYNLGDVGGSFKWFLDKNSNEYHIDPMEGFIPIGTSITFSITFKPTHTSNLIETKGKCVIEGFPVPLEITLNGSCFDEPPPKEKLMFSCSVRETDSKTIALHNPTGESWTLTPTLKGQYFIAPEIVTIDPGSTKDFEIVYKPLLTTVHSVHEAQIFFNIPEGKGLTYALEGVAKRPKPEGIITRQITCKTDHTEVLAVKNWMKSSQRFQVVTEFSSSESFGSKPLYKLSGNQFIEVLAQGEREYYWKIHVLNEGTLNFNVVFQNLNTKEYLYYDVQLIVTTCAVLDVIKLSTCLRKSVTHSIKLQNPIKQPVVFTVKSTTPELTCENQLTLNQYSEHNLDVKYTPVSLGENKAKLQITSEQLGSYLYNFELTGNLPVPEPHVTIVASLGQKVSQKAFLYNPTIARADFKAEFAHPKLFQLQKNITAMPHVKVEFGINFEPNQIGTVQSSLALISPATGLYIYPLIGTCVLPKPQGPFFVKPESSTTIHFKNPFETAENYDFAVEPAIFSLKQMSAEILPKEEAHVAVSLVPYKNLKILVSQKYPITGKLIIYPVKSQLSHIKWIYYLQGDLAGY